MTPITQPAAAMHARQASTSHHTRISRHALTRNLEHKRGMAKSDQQLAHAAGDRQQARAMLSEASR